MKNTTGLTIFDGKSKLNGDDIIVIATLKTDNIKTGNLIQTWILPKNVSPLLAINTGQDSSTCSCNLRGQLKEQYYNVGGIVGITHKTTKNKNRICYVATFTAPQNIWYKYHRGEYPILDRKTQKFLENKKIRLTSVGDPASIPVKIWQKLINYSSGWTGYTHNWKNKHNNCLKNICQASTQSAHDTKIAWEMGWKTFRISQSGRPLKGEIVCPASAHKIKCEQCMLCNGQKANIVIKVHGTKGKICAFRKLMEGIK